LVPISDGTAVAEKTLELTPPVTTTEAAEAGFHDGLVLVKRAREGMLTDDGAEEGIPVASKELIALLPATGWIESTMDIGRVLGGHKPPNYRYRRCSAACTAVRRLSHIQW
jgi:hypothetical protein